MALKKHISLKVYDQPIGGKTVLDSGGLAVEFDIREIPDFSRATFVIYNLTEAAVKSLMDGDRFITLKARHGDGPEWTLAQRFKINNVVDELKLPNRSVTIYAYNELKSAVLDTQIDIEVTNPTLENIISAVLGTAKHSGPITYLSFPEGLTKEAPPRRLRHLQGSAGQCLRRLQEEYDFNLFTDGPGITFVYKPDLNNVDRTDLGDRPVIQLQTSAMRSNPKVGIASAAIDSNLDGRIRPGNVIDLSQLLTVGVSTSENAQQLVDNYLQNFSRYSRYQAFAIQHKGGNYNKNWNTVVTGLSPTEGKYMPTVNWAQ
jgi:hypothetical protein